MKISIASDHAGFEQKQALVGYLASKGHDVIDRGPDCDDRVDYPANKIDGIRAANVTSPLFAALAREHNDANVVAVSGRFVDESVNREILDAFVSTSFGGGRHAGRVEKIAALENE